MSNTSSEHELLQRISDKLDRVIGLLATMGKEPNAKIEILASLGLDAPEIGRLVEMSGNSVRLRKSRSNPQSQNSTKNPT